MSVIFFHKTTVSVRKHHSGPRFCNNVVVSRQVKNMVAVLGFFNHQKGSVTSNKNTRAIYTSNKE